MKIAELILKVYQYRYNKFNNKIYSIKDILQDNIEETKEFQEKIEILEKLDAKMSQIEAKIQIINKRLDKTSLKLDSFEKNFNIKININNDVKIIDKK